MATTIIDVENGKIKIGVKSLAGLIACIFVAYFWLLATFATDAEAGELAEKLQNHIVESMIYRIDLQIDDIEDKKWALQEKMAEENGNTVDRRQKIAEWNKRMENLKAKKLCWQTTDGKNCRNGMP